MRQREKHPFFSDLMAIVRCALRKMVSMLYTLYCFSHCIFVIGIERIVGVSVRRSFYAISYYRNKTSSFSNGKLGFGNVGLTLKCLCLCIYIIDHESTTYLTPTRICLYPFFRRKKRQTVRASTLVVLF